MSFRLLFFVGSQPWYHFGPGHDLGGFDLCVVVAKPKSWPSSRGPAMSPDPCRRKPIKNRDCFATRENVVTYMNRNTKNVHDVQNLKNLQKMIDNSIDKMSEF